MRRRAVATLLGFVVIGCTDSTVVTAPARTMPPAARSLSSGAWSLAGSAPTAFAGAASGVINGKIYVAGGVDPSCWPTSCAYGRGGQVFDPSTGSWNPIAPVPYDIGYADGTGAGAVVNGKLYLLTGCLPTAAGSTTNSIAYDPATNSWAALQPAPHPRCAHGSAVVNGRIYLFGGSNNTSPLTYYTAVDIYDPATDSWSSATPASDTHVDQGAAVVGSTVYLFGGNATAAQAGNCIADVFAFDTQTQGWSTRTPMPGPRCAVNAVTVSGKIYVFGGGTTGRCCATDLWIYDPANDSWATGPSVPVQRLGMMAQLVGGTLYIGGGDTFPPAMFGDVYALTVLPDVTPPVITYTGNTGTYRVDQNINITCTATDPTPSSGIVSNTCANIVGPAYTFPLGTNTFSATATDGAGNVGTGSTSFVVTVSFTSLENVVAQVVTSAGEVKSLNAKLDAAAAAAARGNTNAKAGQLAAFVNEVRAQSGKTIPASIAAILAQLANTL